jgi:guanine deaminase
MSLFLEAAIDLSKESVGGPFGAVVVKDNKIIGKGSNVVIPNSDPTAHAEICAIREAALSLKTHDLTGCVLYTSCYPCPMCLSAIYWAGIKEIIYANTRYDAEDIGFSDKFIYEQLELPDTQKDIKIIRKNNKLAKLVMYTWNGSLY